MDYVNIINFERIRQELFQGRSVRTAVIEGQQLSLSAIFDAQFTTLISALIMYIWGNGTVKGFATMLIITVIMTLVLNVALSKLLLSLIVDSGVCDNKPEWFGVKKNQIPDVSKGESQFYSDTKKFDYMGKGKIVIRIALGIGAERGGVVGFDITRRDGIHIDAPCCPFIRQKLGDPRKAALRRRVGWNPDAALEGKHGGDVDDLRGPFRRKLTWENRPPWIRSSKP